MIYVLFAFALIIILIGGVYLFGVIVGFSNIFPEDSIFHSLFSSTEKISSISVESTNDLLLTLFSYFQVISLFVSLILIMGIIYCKFKTNEAKKLKKAKMYAAKKAEAELMSKMPKKERQKWDIIEAHEKSSNPSDWRLSILEADILLDELLKKLGYQGANLGERLKQVKPEEMASLESAWEAHKIRNAIAHEGSDFSLTQAEAHRVINLYQSVFLEFDFI